jgi:hypothetical protein
VATVGLDREDATKLFDNKLRGSGVMDMALTMTKEAIESKLFDRYKLTAGAAQDLAAAIVKLKRMLRDSCRSAVDLFATVVRLTHAHWLWWVGDVVLSREQQPPRSNHQYHQLRVRPHALHLRCCAHDLSIDH